jgi:hypothetical protein
LGFEALSGWIEQRVAQGEAAADGGEAGVFDENLAGRLGRQAKPHLEVRQRHPGVDEVGAQDLVGRAGRRLQAVEGQAEIEARDGQVLAGEGKSFDNEVRAAGEAVPVPVHRRGARHQTARLR